MTNGLEMPTRLEETKTENNVSAQLLSECQSLSRAACAASDSKSTAPNLPAADQVLALNEPKSAVAATDNRQAATEVETQEVGRGGISISIGFGGRPGIYYNSNPWNNYNNYNGWNNYNNYNNPWNNHNHYNPWNNHNHYNPWNNHHHHHNHNPWNNHHYYNPNPWRR